MPFKHKWFAGRQAPKTSNRQRYDVSSQVGVNDHWSLVRNARPWSERIDWKSTTEGYTRACSDPMSNRRSQQIRQKNYMPACVSTGSGTGEGSTISFGVRTGAV